MSKTKNIDVIGSANSVSSTSFSPKFDTEAPNVANTDSHTDKMAENNLTSLQGKLNSAPSSQNVEKQSDDDKKQKGVIKSLFEYFKF